MFFGAFLIAMWATFLLPDITNIHRSLALLIGMFAGALLMVADTFFRT